MASCGRSGSVTPAFAMELPQEINSYYEDENPLENLIRIVEKFASELNIFNALITTHRQQQILLLIAEREAEIAKRLYMETQKLELNEVRRPMVALTFDDGPSEFTNYIIDLLEYHGGRATFCVLGNRVENWAETIFRIHETGNEVIGHSWDHTSFTTISVDAVREQIQNTSSAIKEIIGIPPAPIFRAPYGALNSRVRGVARELEYSILNWTVDPSDWRDRDATVIYDHIMNNVIDGSVVVLHDVHDTTLLAMEKVIPSLIEQGFQLVTATELIDYFYGGLVAGGEHRGVRPGETERVAVR